ncbi:hypothetical protein L3Q82_026265, partial [Scortum barcoo]
SKSARPATGGKWRTTNPEPGIGVDDAVIYLLAEIPVTSGNTVRITFFDLDDPVLSTHPHLTAQGEATCCRDPCHLTWRTLETLTLGAPQGTVLSPFLFTLYTSDFTYSTDSCHLQKFSDDTAIVGCVSEGNDCEYRKVIMDFVDWCELNHLQVNASKTKEMVIDFSRKPSADIAPAEHPGT